MRLDSNAIGVIKRVFRARVCNDIKGYNRKISDDFGHSRYSGFVVSPLIHITRLFRHLKATFAFYSQLVPIAERIVYLSRDSKIDHDNRRSPSLIQQCCVPSQQCTPPCWSGLGRSDCFPCDRAKMHQAPPEAD